MQIKSAIPIMFTQKDVAEYYNTTQIHYEKWWDLEKGLSLHYGIWEDGIKNFTASLVNTNRVLLEKVQLKKEDRMLDAGCGVGGAALFAHQNSKARVTGITLSEKQVAYANAMAKKKGVADHVDFQLMDYTKTNFPDESFDVVWACESVSSAPDQHLFIEEAFRLLKKGGRLIMSDCYLTSKDQKDPKNWIKKWGETWGVSKLVTVENFQEGLEKSGFNQIEIIDYTQQVVNSAKRMYYAALLGAIPSEFYNLFHPKVSRFAKSHYKSGYFQYKALKEDLWVYKLVHAVK